MNYIRLINGYKNIIRAYKEKDYEHLYNYKKTIFHYYNFIDFPPSWLNYIQKYFEIIPKSFTEKKLKVNDYSIEKPENNIRNFFSIVDDAKVSLRIDDGTSLSIEIINMYINSKIADKKLQKKCFNYIKTNNDLSITNYETLNYVIKYFKIYLKKPKCIGELVKWIVDDIIKENNIDDSFFLKYIPLLAFKLDNSNCFLLNNINYIDKDILDSDDFIKIIKSPLFIFDGKWYRFINSLIYKYLLILYVKNNDYTLYEQYHYITNDDDLTKLNYKLPIEIAPESYSKYIHLILSDFFNKITVFKNRYEIVAFFFKYFNIKLGFDKYKNNNGYSTHMLHDEICDLMHVLTGYFTDDCFNLELFSKPGMKKYIKWNFYRSNIKDEYIFDSTAYYNDEYYMKKLEKYGVVDFICNYYSKMKRLYEYSANSYYDSVSKYSRLLKNAEYKNNEKNMLVS